MLYNVNEELDLAHVYAAIDGFATGWGLDGLEVDEAKLKATLRGMRQDFPAQGEVEAASPFKKAANFLCYFVANRPVKNPFPEEFVGKSVASVPNHQNAMLGLHIVIDALHNAVLFKDSGFVSLENRILFSKHSYIDIVEACSALIPASHFHLMSVFLEQMSYRFNPDASYDLVI